MYKHILVPTDGSKLAARGIREAVRLAKSLKARITGVHVGLPFEPPIYSEAVMFYSGPFSRAQYEKIVKKMADKHLAKIKRQAQAAGVRCQTVMVTDYAPWRGLLRTARARKCDVVVMATHGRGAVGGALLGSETTRLLAHSRIPVLVVR